MPTHLDLDDYHQQHLALLQIQFANDFVINEENGNGQEESSLSNQEKSKKELWDRIERPKIKINNQEIDTFNFELQSDFLEKFAAENEVIFPEKDSLDFH